MKALRTEKNLTIYSDQHLQMSRDGRCGHPIDLLKNTPTTCVLTDLTTPTEKGVPRVLQPQNTAGTA